MHILFFTDNFPPEVNAPATRTFEHCREWVKEGHKVTVITCAPNFPTGKIYEGYRNRLWQREDMEGIQVIRVWSYIAPNEGFAKRSIDFISYMMTASLAAPFVRRVDLIIGTSPQFFTVCAAWLASFYRRIPFVFELRDLWPESIKAVGALEDSVIIRMLEYIEMFLYRRAARIVSVTKSFRRTLAARGIDENKIEVITNGVDLGRFSPRPRDKELQDKLGLEDKFVAGYIGTHGMAHALETLLEAAHLLQDSTGGKRIHILFLGDGARKQVLIEKARAMKLENVTFLDTVPKEEVVRYWSLLDVSIIHLKKSNLFKTVIPSKLFECMGMGIPVLHGVQGESAEIVKKEQAGLTFEPENAGELADKLCQLRDSPFVLEQMTKASLAAAKHYSREELARKMLSILLQQAAK